MAFDVQDLFRRHSQELRRFLRRRGHNAETAADIAQDTFLRVLTSPPADACNNYNPRAYLYRVSHNLSVNHKRRERLIQTTDLDAAADVSDPAPSAEKVIYSRQCLAQTRSALAELPDRTRMAFEMHRLDEMTIAEIAAALELSVSRTWVLIRDAYRHLVARIDDF